MNISLDLDGVICQWKHIPKEDRTKENYDRLPLVKGAYKGILELLRIIDGPTVPIGWVNVITARHYRGAQNHVNSWLLDKKIFIDEKIVGIPTSEKWRVMQALDVDIHVDDYIRAFTNVPPHIITILFRGDHNKDQDWPITVKDWPELVQKIKEISNER